MPPPISASFLDSHPRSLLALSPPRFIAKPPIAGRVGFGSARPLLMGPIKRRGFVASRKGTAAAASLRGEVKIDGGYGSEKGSVSTKRITLPTILTLGRVAAVPILRDVTMSAVREWAASQDSKLLEAVAVNNLKTATQMIGLTILLATRDPSLARPDFLVASGVVLLYLSAGLALWSLAMYMRKIYSILLQ